MVESIFIKKKKKINFPIDKKMKLQMASFFIFIFNKKKKCISLPILIALQLKVLYWTCS
jgi:hypothetical protein